MNLEPAHSILAETRNAVARTLTCIECCRPWFVASERWRLKLTDEEPRESVPYCPNCATREFG
jgi:hypothetical protein